MNQTQTQQYSPGPHLPPVLDHDRYVAAATAWISDQQPAIFITHTNTPHPADRITARAPGANGRPERYDGWEVTEKRLQHGYHRLSQIVYGRNYWRSKKEGICWAGSLEPQKNGAPHAHSLCWAPGRDLLQEFTDRKTVRRGKFTREVVPTIEDVFRTVGFGKIVAAEVIKDPEECAHYCVKYSVKHGGVLAGGYW